MKWLEKTGEFTITRWRNWCILAASIAVVLKIALTPRSWNAAVRSVFMKQVYFTGVNAIGLVSFIGILTGVSVVVQAQLWLGKFGQSEMLGPILVAVVLRELGPLLINFIIIGRSGTAIAIEIGNMRAGREINVLQSQGVDPMIYLIMPRVLGVAVSVFCLSVILCAITFLSGFGIGAMLGVTPPKISLFLTSVFTSLSPVDFWNIIAKTVFPGLFIGAICCLEGFTISGIITEVPQAGTRAVVKSITAVLIISAIISLFTYV